ncbi:DUF4097 family beta strand repeat-containing protein [Mucilaginibacter sp. McL0603]|uniref:DUF4097 family beta strand repeat-containing protein n=1 Tax=Mucilaginibacter sp. McL0603 TaxID=3415670 RepID=UPI003CF7213C
MKTFILSCFIAMQAATCLAQDDKTPYLTKSLASDAINSVIVNTSAGGIEVSGQSGQQPRVEVYIRGNNNRVLSKEEIKKRLDEDYDLSVTVNGHEVTAIAKTKHHFDNWRNQISISFKVFVPENSSTDLKTSGGGIQLDHLKGTENFTTSGGGLQIDHLIGMIHGHTSGGGIEVSNSSEDIDLQTSGGGINAKNCSGKIKLNTSGGGLRLENLKGEINAHTSGGGVEGSNIEGELITSTSGGGIDLKGMNCSLDATTSAGSLNAQMIHVGKYLRLNSSAGNVNIELPAKQGLDLNLRGDRVNQHQFNGFNGEWNENHVRGTVNGGGVPVTASASSGDINVRFN